MYYALQRKLGFCFIPVKGGWAERVPWSFRVRCSDFRMERHRRSHTSSDMTTTMAATHLEHNLHALLDVFNQWIYAFLRYASIIIPSRMRGDPSPRRYWTVTYERCLRLCATRVLLCTAYGTDREDEMKPMSPQIFILNIALNCV